MALHLSTIGNCLYAHVDEIDEKGGHWYYRLGVYHQHHDFEGSVLDGTYESHVDTYRHFDYKMRFYRLGVRTYQIDNGKHAFGIQSGLQLDSQFDYGRQWTLGLNYRRRYSENTTLTYRIDYYRANQFNIVDYTVLWGIYYPQLSKKWSLHTGIILSTANDWNSNMGAWVNMLECDIGVGILTFRYYYFGVLSIFSTGVTYKI